MRHIAVLALAGLFCLGAGERRTIHIGLAFAEDTFHYDPTRASELEVRRWIQLSPEVSRENFYQIPEWIEYDKPISAQNAPHTLDRIRQRMKDLDPAQYPPDLREVVLYLREIQRFCLWKETQRFIFWKKGDLAALKSKFDGIDPSFICSAALTGIAAAPTKEEANKLAWHGWGDCVGYENRKRTGDYPKAAWEKFLNNHGIEEHYVEQFPDD